MCMLISSCLGSSEEFLILTLGLMCQIIGLKMCTLRSLILPIFMYFKAWYVDPTVLFIRPYGFMYSYGPNMSIVKAYAP